MLGAKEIILVGIEYKITSRPKESWKTPACKEMGEEKRRIMDNSFT